MRTRNCDKEKYHLSADFVHTSSTHGTFAFHGWFAIFHRDFGGVWVVSFGATFDAIHRCHKLTSPPSTKSELPAEFSAVDTQTTFDTYKK